MFVRAVPVRIEITDEQIRSVFLCLFPDVQPDDRVAVLFFIPIQVLFVSPDEFVGLVLAVTRQFVDLLGGEISLGSELGQGSSFKVSLQLQPARGLASTSAEAGKSA